MSKRLTDEDILKIKARTTLGQQISDAFLPDDLKIILYRRYISVGDADINGWSLVHMFSGVIIGLLGFNWWQALLIHTGWEIYQAIVGDNRLDFETLIDVPLDTLFFMFGWYIVYYLKFSIVFKKSSP